MKFKANDTATLFRKILAYEVGGAARHISCEMKYRIFRKYEFSKNMLEAESV